MYKVCVIHTAPGWLSGGGAIYTVPGWLSGGGAIYTVPGWLSGGGAIYTVPGWQAAARYIKMPDHVRHDKEYKLSFLCRNDGKKKKTANPERVYLRRRICVIKKVKRREIMEYRYLKRAEWKAYKK